VTKAPRLLTAIGAATLAAMACGGSSNSNAPTPPPTTTCTAPATSTTITISNNAACPQNITVARGTRVTFVNQDSRSHEMVSDPHPEHTDCIELNQVGNLEIGQSRESGNLTVSRPCGFHDHLRNEVAALRGTITISQ
jgi:plastocyanin